MSGFSFALVLIIIFLVIILLEINNIREEIRKN
jgi:hypothetical protein